MTDTNPSTPWCNSKSRLQEFGWNLVNQLFFKNPFSKSQSLKKSLLTKFGAQIGNEVIIEPCSSFAHPWNLKIGNKVKIAKGVKINCFAPIRIQNRVTLGNMVILETKPCGIQNPGLDQLECAITIKNDVCIGEGSIIKPGIICYSGSSLAPHSTAMTDLAPNCHYAGKPARFNCKGNEGGSTNSGLRPKTEAFPKNPFLMPFSVSL